MYRACSFLNLNVHFVVVVSQGTKHPDQIEFLKKLRVTSDNAKLGRYSFITIVLISATIVQYIIN